MTTAPPTLSTRRIAIASAIGAVIEWYDFFLYGTAAGLVFTDLFFSGLTGATAQFASFGTFAVGFLARPVGGLIFGHFGDRLGRKKMLVLTLLIMGLGTAAIGLLPTYAQIGIWAPILLVTLRVLQGIGIGGEYDGGVLIAAEFAPPKRRGYFASFAHIGVPGGLLLASSAFFLASLLPDQEFLTWGWRACFLLSTALLAVGAWIRLSVMETPAFARVQERKEIARVPLRELLAHQSGRLLLGMGTRFIEGFTFNFFSVYLLTYVVTTADISKSFALIGIACGAGVGVVLVPISGALTDRFGRKPVYRIGTWLALAFAFPGAALAQSGNRLEIFIMFVIGLGVLYGTIYGPLASFWSELFSTRYRYTALSTLYQGSGVVASGMTPLIAGWLAEWASGTLWLVAAYNVLVAVISLTCARFLPETRGFEIERAVEAPADPAVLAAA